MPGILTDTVTDLVRAVTSVVDNDAAAISIRDRSSVYLYVNPEWRKIAGITKEQVVGKRLTDLNIVPQDQAERFIEEDKKLQEEKSLVVIDNYDVRGKSMRLMAVRAFVSFNHNDYVVEVSTVLKSLSKNSPAWEVWQQLETVLGDLLAVRLLSMGVGV